MPQMSPINWLILFIMFTMIFMLFNMLNYYLFYPILPKLFSKNKMKMHSLNWKW